MNPSIEKGISLKHSWVGLEPYTPNMGKLFAYILLQRRDIDV